MFRLLAATVGLALILALPGSAGQNPTVKTAVHVLPHDAGRTCSGNFPEIPGCGHIVTTYAGCDEIDIFPVFFDLVEYQGIEYGIVWPGYESCSFTSCSDLKIGDIVNPGDGISHAWSTCQMGPVVVMGWGWIGGFSHGSVCIIAHPGAGGINVGDCTGGLDEAAAVYCAGVCGETGDMPCDPVFVALDLDKTDGLGGYCVLPGDSINYTLSYDNSPNSWDVHNTIVTDRLPPEVELVSASGGGDYDPGTHTVTWNVGTVPAGGSGVFEITVSVDESTAPATTLANICEITSGETPSTEVTEYTDVCPEFAPLNLSKGDGLGGGCVDAGMNIAYVIDYDNTSNEADVHNVAITDVLPPETEFVSSTHGGIYDPGGHTIAWGIGTLPAGGGGAVGVLVHVPPATTPGMVLVNTCEITSDEAPPTEVTEYADVCPAGFAPLILSKSDGLDGFCLDSGDSITYTIIYDNTPNMSEVHNATLTDEVPSHMDYVSCSHGGTHQAGSHSVVWDLGTVSGGLVDSVELTVAVGSDASPGEILVNTCRITCDETPVTVARDSVGVCQGSFAPLGLSKTDPFGGSCVVAGQSVMYTISYNNSANTSEVHNVNIVDHVPAQTDFISATGGGVYNAGARTVTWGIGALPGGAGGSVRLTARVKPNTPSWSTIGNTCEITCDETGTKSVTRYTAVCGGHANPNGKVAVHVEPHASRSCSKSFPAIQICTDITYMTDSGDADVFPVFFDLMEYQGFEYGVTWSGQSSCVFTSCSDLTIGGITYPNDGVSHAWTGCQPGPVAVPGWAWLTVDSPCLVYIVGHPQTGSITIGDCSGGAGSPSYSFCAGLAGAVGDDPCVPTRVEPTTWGGIKAMFR
ncbi:MAG: hypothetical protein ABIJ00_14275 [Candidatus Eisenbacteria bacterium]